MKMCFTPLKKYCLSIALCYAWRGWMKEPDNLTVIGRKKKEGKAPHFKMGGGRKMDELRKMHLGREMSSFKMSDHALPFMLLTDFLRLTLLKLRWQMKQPIHALPAGGARKRIQKGKRLGRCTFVSLAVATKGWSVTFTKGGLHQPLITSSSAAGRCDCVGQRCSAASTTAFVWGEFCHGWEGIWERMDMATKISLLQGAETFIWTQAFNNVLTGDPLLKCPWELGLPFQFCFFLGESGREAFLFFLNPVHLVNTSDRNHSYFVCGVIQ